MTCLPDGFEALEPFAESWAANSSDARDKLRGASTAADREAFYGAAKDLMPAALELLDRKPLDGFDEREARLMSLMLSLCHVAPAVEGHREEEPKHAAMRAFMPIIRSPADR